MCLTETDLWPPALKILSSEWLLVRYQPYNNNNNNNDNDNKPIQEARHIQDAEIYTLQRHKEFYVQYVK